MEDADTERKSGAPIVWRDVPTVFADMPLGNTVGGGVIRVVMGELAFNPQPGATTPNWRPVFTWAFPETALETIIAHLEGIRELRNAGR